MTKTAQDWITTLTWAEQNAVGATLQADEVVSIRDALRALVAERDASESFFKDCIFDLRGAGYECVFVGEDGSRWGYLGEGGLVFGKKSKITAIGLHILGPVALAEKIDAAVLAASDAGRV